MDVFKIINLINIVFIHDSVMSAANVLKMHMRYSLMVCLLPERAMPLTVVVWLSVEVRLISADLSGG